MAFFGRNPASPPLSRLDELKKTLQKDPGSRQFLALAEEFRKEGEFAEAVRALENGLRHHPGYVAAHVSFGKLLRECGRPDDALKAFLNALKIDAENLVAIKQSAQIYVEKGDRVEAVKKLKRYRGLNPGDKEVAEQIEKLDLELGTTSRLRVSSQLGAPTPAAPGADPLGPRSQGGVWQASRAASALPLPGSSRVLPPIAQAATEPLPRVVPPLPPPPPAPTRASEALELSYDAAPPGAVGVAGAGRAKAAEVRPPEVFLFDLEPEEMEPPEKEAAGGGQAVGGAGERAPLEPAPVFSTVAREEAAPVPPAPLRAEPRREMVTETLAELYQAQGLWGEARKAFDVLSRAETDPDRASGFRARSRALAAEEAAVRASDPRRHRLEEYLRRIARPDEGPGGLEAIVEGLVGAGVGIGTAIVTETGGVPVVKAGRFGPEDESLAAEMAAFWKNLKRGNDDHDAGPPRLVSLVADSGGALVSGIGDGYALILRVDEGVPLGRVRYRAAQAASRLRPFLA